MRTKLNMQIFNRVGMMSMKAANCCNKLNKFTCDLSPNFSFKRLSRHPNKTFVILSAMEVGHTWTDLK